MTRDEAVARLVILAMNAVEEYDGEHCLNHTFDEALADEECWAHDMAHEVDHLRKIVES